MNGRVLVIGASGSVGHACVSALLAQGKSVLATSRRPHLLRTLFSDFPADRLTIVGLDIVSGAPWPEPLRQCQQIIQCAGPSFRLTNSVLNALLAQIKRPGIFVEVGGDATTISSWQTPLATAGWQGIFGAGVQPGLLGLSIRAIAACFPDSARLHITTFTGGLQSLTPAGLEEYLQAVINRTGYPGLCLQQGERRRECGIPSLPACFPDSAKVHASLDEEADYAARDLSLSTLRCFNVTDSPEITHLLTETMVTGQIPDCAQQRISAALAGRKPYFSLSAQGRDTALSGSMKSLLLSCSDSYAVTGAVAAWAAMDAYRYPMAPGTYWFSQRPASLKIWQEWANAESKNFRVSWNDSAEPDAYEEGAL